ncbi:uncharacterized protein EAE97_007092 [Botrytis byssoidea]|uniref:Uncharacterized protein n=2 Tax=Sclerotiniaceae TaxID=28983 RepID=A0A4Z1IDR0_9HELO|nr:uncharacterized protein EAE97_007092 [Botrytis byssoidea]KAF7940907.1 hypothetical protein EAE97_007092 [Botrytis byssoidea]TGO57150.1 hypothetical protein BOTNAR_0207g00020 [Botryotinia narcissicola]
MHRPTPSSNTNGGLFKGGNIFGGSKTPTSTSNRPSTSGGSPKSESKYSPTHQPTHQPRPSVTGFSRKPSFSASSRHNRRNNSTAHLHSTLLPNLPLFPTSNSSEKHSAANNPYVVPVNLPLPPSDPRQSIDSYDRVVLAETTGANSFGETLPRQSIDAQSFTSTTPYSKMLARPGTGYQSSGGGPAGPGVMAPMQPGSPTLETITYQHIQEMASKRISTLDYLRKAHEGRVYWFNTLLFNKPDLQRMPYFDARKLARRATNYLLLGLSLPTILDLNSSSPSEFLRTLNALLGEFESFQQAHPPDGSTSSSLSRGRFPQMFKRSTMIPSKGRRTSSATEIGLPMGNDVSDTKSINGSTSSGGGNGATSFPASENDLLPGEEYTHLLTPSLPFDPDFYETFATLCDVLIDCYTRLMSLVSSPKECSPQIAEMFTKADARVRKIIVQGVVKEFEDSSRGGVKSEVAGVGRVVLGGLM